MIDSIEPITENPKLIPHAQTMASLVRSATICSPDGKKRPNDNPTGAIKPTTKTMRNQNVVVN